MRECFGWAILVDVLPLGRQNERSSGGIWETAGGLSNSTMI